MANHSSSTFRRADSPVQSLEPEKGSLNPSTNTLGPWARVAIALSVSALCIVGYLQLSNMDTRFFQLSPSGAKGLFFYLVGDDLTASKAYRDHFKSVVTNHKNAAKFMAIEILSGELEPLQKNAELALKSDPNNPNALLTLGAVALERGNPEQASLFFNQVLETLPDHARGLLYSAIAHARIGHFEKALYQINRGLRNNQIAWDYYSFLVLLETAGSFNDKPNSDKPWSFLAQLYRYLRIFDPSNGSRGIEYAQQAVEANNFPAHAYVTMSVVYTKQGKLVQALEAARKSTEVDKNFPDGYSRAGYIYGRMGDIANSYLMYKAAFELAPEESLFVRNLGYVMMEKLGDAEQTIQLFERVVQANPLNWYAYKWLGQAYTFLGNHQKAVSRYKGAREISLEAGAMYKGETDYIERVVDIHEELASSQRKLGHIDDAIETLHRAIEFAPSYVGPRVSLAYYYKEVNRYEEAVQEIDIALQSRGLGINAHSGLCSVLYEAYESQRAADCFRRVLKRDPHDMRARRLLPEVLRTVKRENANLNSLGQAQP